MSLALIVSLLSLLQPVDRACGWGDQRPRLAGSVEQGGLLRGQVSREITRITVADREVALAPDGRFLVGIDRDEEGPLWISYWNRCGERLAERSVVSSRQWNLQRVNVARNLPREGEESWTRREAEVLRTQAARAQRTDAEGWRQNFIWPARGRISGRFGSQRIYRGEPGSYHGGVDVAAAAGSPVVAPADGVVVEVHVGHGRAAELRDVVEQMSL